MGLSVESQIFFEWLKFPAIPWTYFWSSFLIPTPLWNNPHFSCFHFPSLLLSSIWKLNCSTPTHLSRSHSNDNSGIFHNASSSSHCFFSLQRFHLFIFRERGREGEREGERNIDVQEIRQLVASHTPPTEDLTCNPGMCPDWGLNPRPFGSQAAQSTEPHQ